MQVFTTRWFRRWAAKEGLGKADLLDAVAEMCSGLVDAELGGGLVKKRIARPGQGKRGGFRTLVATNRGDRWVFVFGFSKNMRGNIDATEELALKQLATHLLGLTPAGVRKAVEGGELTEVTCDA